MNAKFTGDELYELWDYRYNTKRFTILQYNEWLKKVASQPEEMTECMLWDMQIGKGYWSLADQPKSSPCKGEWVDATPFKVKETRAEKETAMYACANSVQQDIRTEAQQAKDYLILSLEQAMNTQFSQAAEDFNIYYNGPKTMGELREYLKKGWVTLREEYEDELEDDYKFDWSDPKDFLQLRDPDRKADPKGYEAALKQIRKDAADVKDQIVVFGPEKGLEALNAFKAKKFS